MKLMSSIGLTLIAVVSLLASIVLSYIAGYYVDEYDELSASMRDSGFFVLFVIILFFVNLGIVIFTLTRTIKQTRFLLFIQLITVLMSVFLTVAIYCGYAETRDAIRETNNDPYFFLDDYIER